MFDIQLEKTTDADFIKKWQSSLKEACDLAKKNAIKSAGQGKKNYDKKKYGGDLVKNDRVLVRNLSERGGTGKLRSFWEEKIHIVKECDDKLPVYHVVPEDGKGRERVVHRNLLMKCELLPSTTTKHDDKKKTNINKPTTLTSKSKSKPVVETVDDSDSSDDEEMDDAVRRYILQKLLKSEKKKGRRVGESSTDNSEIGAPGNLSVIESEIGDQTNTEVVEDETGVPGNQSSVQEENQHFEAESENEEDFEDDETETGTSADETDPDYTTTSDDSSTKSPLQRPVRTRRPPRLFTYDKNNTAYYTTKPFSVRPKR